MKKFLKQYLAGTIFLLIVAILMFFYPNDTKTFDQSDPSMQANGFIPIGTKINVLHIQHDTGNQYELEVEENGKLVWKQFGEELTVKLAKDGESSYLERMDDSAYKQASYILYQAKNDNVTAGEYSKTITVGRGRTTETYHPNMVQ